MVKKVIQVCRYLLPVLWVGIFSVGSATATSYSSSVMAVVGSIDSKTANVGDNICVSVRVNELTNIVGMSFSIRYDSTKLEFTAIDSFGLPGISEVNRTDFLSFPTANGGKKGLITMAYTSPGLSPVSLANNSRIFVLCFKVLSTTTNEIVFSSSPTPQEAIDSNERSIGFSGTKGVISAPTSGGGGGTGGGGSSAACGGTFSNLTLVVETDTVSTGREVCLNICASKFTDIVGLQFVLNYDTAKLTFKSVGAYGLPGITEVTKADYFGLPGVGSVPQGRVSFVYTSPGLTPVNLADGTTIWQVCFTAKTTTGPTDVTIGGIEATNGNEQRVVSTGVKGVVTIGAGSTGGGGGGTTTNACGGTFNSFTLVMESDTVRRGNEVCLNVCAAKFTDLIGLQFTINYDAAKLQYKSIGSFGLPGVTSVNQSDYFGLPVTGGTTPGKITLVYTSPGLNATTLADGTTLFQICFTALDSAGTTDVTFGSNPTPFEATNKNEQNVPVANVKGVVSFVGSSGNTGGGGGGGNQGSGCNSTYTVPTMVIESKAAQLGQEVCVNVCVSNFSKITGAQLTIKYNPGILSYKSIGQFGLPGINNTNTSDYFGLPTGGTGATPAGTITLVYTSPGLNPVTLANGTTVFQLCFNVVGNTTTDITFSGTPTAIEFVDDAERGVPFTMLKGTITLGGNPNGPSLSAQNVTPVNCFGQSTGAIDITPTGGTGNYTYKWSYQNLSTQDLSNIPAGQYTVTITDSGNSLTSTANFTVAQPTAALAFSNIGVTPVNCFGESTGKIQLTIGGGTSPYTYAWNNSLPAAALQENLLAGNSYRVTVTDSRGCVLASDPISVTAPTAPLRIASSPVTDVACFGEANGSIRITAAGGTSPYTYAWTNSLPASATQNNLGPGSYRVTVTDSKGCTVSSTALTVRQPTAALAITNTVIMDAVCASDSSGSIAVTVGGGTSPYTYTWAGGLTGNTGNQTKVPAGQYTLTVTDSRNCRATSGLMTVVAANPGITVQSIVPGTIRNGNDGSVTLTASGGNGNFSYSWKGPGTFTATTRNLTALSTPGEYCVTITDGAGCSMKSCVVVPEKVRVVNGTADRTCAGQNTGKITLDVTGGRTPYTYRWNTGATTKDISNIAAGTYSVTITDADNDQITYSTEVRAFDAITPNATVVGATNTSTPDGSVSLAPTGGQAPYTYRWANNATTAGLTNLGTGDYCVTITDARGCTTPPNTCFTIGLKGPLTHMVTGVGAKCNGQASGAIEFAIQGGLPSYTITFEDGTNLVSGTGSVTRSNLAAGTYKYTITDAAGATKQGTVGVQQPAAMTIPTVTVVHDTELAGCVGEIGITIAGGQTPYAVAWSNGGGGLQTSNLCEGSYRATVTDNIGCTIQTPAYEVTTFRATGAVSNASCPTSLDGKVELTISGGATPYSYEWKNAAGMVVANTANLLNVIGGTYTLRVSEASGNTLTKTFTISSTSTLAVTASVTPKANGMGLLCGNNMDAVITASATNGTGPYSYEWFRGEQMVATGSTFPGAGLGAYQVVAIDAKNCEATANVTVTGPPALQLSGTVVDVTCAGLNNGGVSVLASGGSNPTAGFTLRWSNNVLGNTINSVVAGTYTVTVTAADGCSITKSYAVTTPEPVRVVVETEPATDGCNGVAKAIVTGGTAPYTFNWASNPQVKVSQLSNVCPGELTLEVIDSKGCKPVLSTAVVRDRRFACIEERMVLTPDGDGLNEFFIINCIEEFPDNELEVFDRWGALVYEAEGYANQWDGKDRSGNILPQGPYYFVLHYTDGNNIRVQVKGSLTILRE